MNHHNGVLKGGLVGFMAGLAIAFFGVSQKEREIEILNTPTSIVEKHMNDDDIIDRVIKYSNGKEIVMYGLKKADGSIDYSLPDQ